MEATTISTVLIKQRSKQQFHQLQQNGAYIRFNLVLLLVRPKIIKVNKKLAFHVICVKQAVTLVDLTMIFNTSAFRLLWNDKLVEASRSIIKSYLYGQLYININSMLVSSVKMFIK